VGFNQRDRRWAAHALGFGPHLGTIGAYGCVLSTAASIAKLAGVDTDPPRLDEAFIRHGSIFERDPTGTFDFLPDNSLTKLMPERFQWLGSYRGLRSDLIARSLPTPDVYVELHISTHAVPTHRVYVWSGRHGTYLVDDPWGRLNAAKSVVHPLADYGGAAAVAKTILQRALSPAPKPDFKPLIAPRHPPQPKPPDPLVPDEPLAFYLFVQASGQIAPEPPPSAQTTYLSCAKTLANEWVADRPGGTVLAVLDADGTQVYVAASTPNPFTA